MLSRNEISIFTRSEILAIKYINIKDKKFLKNIKMRNLMQLE